MRVPIVVIAVLVLTMSCPGVLNADEGSGGQAGAFLRVPTGARAVALGGAFVALADDVSALQYNPAGLGRIVGVHAEASYSEASMDRNRVHGGVIYGTDSIGALGVHVSGLRIVDIDGRDELGNPTGAFDDSEMSLSLGYARNLGKTVSLGVGAAYLSHELESHSASGYAFSVGLLGSYDVANVHVRRMKLGASASQIAGNLEWDTASGHDDDLPVTYRVGLAIDLEPGGAPLTISTQATSTEEQDVTAQIGAELTVVDVLTLRGGWDGNRASLGAGIRVGAVRLDYAYYDDVLEEGATHWVGIALSPRVESAKR